MHQSNRRFPILLWGDLVEGRRPVLRRALAGFRAHECMYAWVYLTEYLALRRLLDLSQDMPAGERRNVIQALDGDLWARLDRSAVDPHCQLSKSGFEAVAHMACLAAQSGEMHPVFVELGSTFFASKTKFEIVDQVARAWFAEWPRLQPRWVGIDNCLFMRDTACLLHGQAGVELVGDYRAVAKPDGFAVFWSRFVASYVFQSSIEFAGYLADRFQAIVVEDAYSTTAQDVPVFNHGQPEVFFSAPTVMGALEQADFEIHILDWYPDFPAGSAPCHVIRYLAAKKGLLTGRVKDYLAGLGFNQPGPPVLAATLLDQLNAAVTPRQWRAVKLAKRQSPVWGRTP
ncbi:MAG: hypothetical protein FJW20_27305, partial [Acidimicrobiia bacterium]|nr:hypothetical protein [Acidimicrobiia bacterium]